MFYILSKTLDLFATPVFWGLALGGLALLSVRRRNAAAAMRATLAAIAVSYFFALEPVANALLRHVEGPARSLGNVGRTPYEPGPIAAGPAGVPYDAVVVLGGMVDEDSDALDYNEAVERLLAGYDVLRTGRARYALICGGRASPDVPQAEATTVARQLVAWNIAPERIVEERESRNTHENAVFAARIVHARGWSRLLLVTSAFHFERAAGCFRHEGLSFDPMPVDFRAYDPARFSGSWLPRADALSESTVAMREMLGRVVYRVQGYSSPWP